MNFVKGDVIDVLCIKSDDWVLGKLRGVTGLVPASYVTWRSPAKLNAQVGQQENGQQLGDNHEDDVCLRGTMCV